MNCLCFGVILNWFNRFGNRLTALEQKVDYLEKHVIIDIHMLEKNQ